MECQMSIKLMLLTKLFSIAAVWDAHARLYHGYEIKGLENLPKDGKGLIIYYHGAIPIDMYYFVASIYLKYDRLIYTVGDRFLFKLPGWKIIAQVKFNNFHHHSI